MSKTKLFILASLTLAASPCVAQQRTVYMPGIAVCKVVVSPADAIPAYGRLLLRSFLMLYNNGDTLGRVARVAGFGTSGPMQVVWDASPILLGPGDSNSFLTIDFSGGCGNTQNIEIGQYELSDGVVPTPTLVAGHSALVDCDFSTTSPPGADSEISQGRIPLPVFEGLFAAGTRTASGDIVPFNEGPTLMCGQKYVRRINLTLFNGGHAPATFTVKAHKRETAGTTQVVFTSTYGVSAESVEQFNSIFTLPITSSWDFAHTSNLWFTITADQPYLAYVSTTFDDPQRGAIPYEIFPAKLK